MTQTSFTLPALLVLALAACQQPASNSDIAIDNGVNAAATDIETLPPDETVDENGTGQADNAIDARLPTQIPAQYRGRWGMVPADCTSTRGDAKGLITVADRTIRFYESTATLKAQRPAIATSFSGLFGFTGEGQTWDKVETLTRTGETLKRADSERSYTYKRCTA